MYNNRIRKQIYRPITPLDREKMKRLVEETREKLFPQPQLIVVNKTK